MDGNRTQRRLRLRKPLALAAVLLLTAPAGGPAWADPSDVSTFDASFAHYAAVAPTTVPAAGAVDVSAIEPAIEAEPASTALGGGMASYYGRKFDGRRTASGETFDMHQLTAAHRTLPFGSRVRVTNPANGKSVIVRINDRGPYSGARLIDLSRAAAEQIDIVRAGHGRVELALLED